MKMIKPMRTITSVSTLCLIMAFTSAFTVNAASDDLSFEPAHHQQKGEIHQKSKLKKMFKALSLSEEQKLQIRAIKKQAKEQHKLQSDTMKKFKEEQRALAQAKLFDEQAFIALHEAYQPTLAQMALIKAKSKHAIFNVLTTEQQQKWHKIMEKRKEKFNR